MPYATIRLRGCDRDIEYRILSQGPGSGWEYEWQFTDPYDRHVLADLSPAEEELLNGAINRAEGNAP